MKIKLIITLILLSTAALSGIAQEQQADVSTHVIKIVALSDQKEDTDQVCKAVQKKPAPTVNLIELFTKNIRYPKAARKAQVEGRVTVEVVVEKDGSLSNVRVVRGREISHGLPEEAVRVVKSMPKWQPAINFGKVVRSYYTMPVDFKLK